MSTRDFKCPNCGGNIEFNIETQGMKCPFCDTEFDMQALASFDGEENSLEADAMEWKTSDEASWAAGETDGMDVFSCKSCGGEIITSENTGMTSCPYCGNPVVRRGQFSGDLKPDYVIPFKFDKKAAKEALANHMKGKKLLPKAFIDGKHIDEIKGVYVPFWLFDADAHADCRFDAKKERAWSDSNYRYKETSFYKIVRSGNLKFKHVPADASSQMPDDLMESIEPYDFSELVPFSTPYLSGYMADKYDVSREDSIERANKRIKETIENDLKNTVSGYTTVSKDASSVRFSDGKCHYALLPVWLLQTSWNGENFLFAMNGQTGKFVGNLPMDKSLYGRYFAIFSAIGFVVSMIISAFVL